MKSWLACLFLAWVMAAQAGPLALPPVPHVTVTQRLHARLPLSLVFVDEMGVPVELRQLFDRGPVVLTFGYFHCPNLCSTVMEGVLQSLAVIGLPTGDFRIVAVSIDPRETPQLAAQKKIAYAPMLGKHARDLSLLTGSRDAIVALTEAAGFSYIYDARLDQYIHPAGFLIATPKGEIASYFMGVRFELRDLRLALANASEGNIGTVGDRLMLLCSHYDPAIGRYSMAVMRIVRVTCLIVLAILAAWLWRHRRSRQ